MHVHAKLTLDRGAMLTPCYGNPDDGTVMEVATPTPVAPGATARFQIAWLARMAASEGRRP